MDDDGPIVTAAEVLAWRRGGTDGGLPAAFDRAVLVADRGLAEDVRRRRGGRVVDGPSGYVAILRGAAGGSVGIAAPPGIGAPAAAIAIEELVALGARAITFIGYAAALEPGPVAGGVVAIDDALRDEGVSGRYGATGPLATPDPDAAVALAQALEGAGLGDDHGRSWTTDALYRETPSAIARARGAGARVVEMEVAAVYAVAMALHVTTGGAVIVGDRLVDGRWDPPLRFEPIRRRARAAVDAVLDAWMSAPR